MKWIGKNKSRLLSARLLRLWNGRICVNSNDKSDDNNKNNSINNEDDEEEIKEVKEKKEKKY